MKELQKLKPIAEQMLALSTELLGLIDSEEVEYNRLLEQVKKTVPEKYLRFRARRWTKTKKGGQPYISRIRS